MFGGGASSPSRGEECAAVIGCLKEWKGRDWLSGHVRETPLPSSAACTPPAASSSRNLPKVDWQLGPFCVLCSRTAGC